MSRLSRRLFSVSLDEVTFARRGFRGGDDAAVRNHIEKIGISFLAGYHAALETPEMEVLAPRLGETEPEYRGFTFEGAGMGLALLDAVTPWNRGRLRAYLEDAGDAHVYVAHVGAGWAMARLPFGLRGIFRRLDPVLRWLAFDGYGFHQGFFHWPESVEGRQAVPRRLEGYARRVFDQGLGRSLWFVEGAGVERLPRTVASFAPERRADLWSGVGLACVYAGGVDRSAVERLRDAGGGFERELAQGAAFAAKARLRAGIPTAHVETACRVLCGCSAAEAAAVTDVTFADLPVESVREGEGMPRYEIWRRRIQEHFDP